MPIWRSKGFKGNKEALFYTILGYNVPEEEQYSPKRILHFKSKPVKTLEAQGRFSSVFLDKFFLMALPVTPSSLIYNLLMDIVILSAFHYFMLCINDQPQKQNKSWV